MTVKPGEFMTFNQFLEAFADGLWMKRIESKRAAWSPNAFDNVATGSPE